MRHLLPARALRPWIARAARLAVAVAAALAPVAHAQALPPDASAALQDAQRAATDALATYDTHLPDAPLWRTALRRGEDAARLAPEHPAPRRFLAQAYLQLGWYARAWPQWEAYLRLGGAVDRTAERQIVETATWLGLQAFDEGRRDAALPYLRTVLAYRPDDVAANARLALAYLETDDPAGALPYLEALAGRVPGLADELPRARRFALYGPVAAETYQEGVVARDAGGWPVALERFLAAADARPDFVDAWRAAGQAALRLDRPDDAERAYLRVLDLAPDDPAALAGLARAAEERDDLDAALARYARALAGTTDPSLEADLRRELEAVRADVDAREAEAAAEAAAQAAAAARAEEAARAEAAARDAAEREAAEREAAQREAADAAAGAAATAAPEATADAAPPRATAPSTQAPAVAPAEPLPLVDATVRHDRRGDGASPAVSFAATTTPGTDLTPWSGGTLHVAMTVTRDGRDAPVQVQVCLVPVDIAVAPACTGPALLTVASSGRYEAEVDWSQLRGMDAVDAARGIDAVMIVLRRPDGTAVGSAEGPPAADGPETASDGVLPITSRLQLVAVARGGAFAGW